MRYATWKIDFTDNPNEGTSPEAFVVTGSLEGGFELQPFTIMGYASDDADLSGLDKWHLVEHSVEHAMGITKELFPDAYVTDNGKIALQPEEQNG